MTAQTVLAHGCFDLLHLGHIRHLAEARALGDRLVVSVTADRFINKGHGRPHFSADQRREALLMLACVDEVVINDAPTAVEMIERLRPAVYVKGIDYAAREDEALAAERAAIEAVGGRFHVTTAEKWSSSQLLRSIRLPTEALIYLERARAKGFFDQIMAAFDRADQMRLLFVGETIVDEYRYVMPLAKPSKEFVLATVAAGEEKFMGGVIAAAKHGGWINADVFTAPQFITKTRWIGADFSRKLFEVYSASEIEPLPEKARETLDRAVFDVDAVIAFDFGHGLFGPQERAIIQGAKFLALTAQTNAGNSGFNPVTRHLNADYVCVDEPEARLAVSDQHRSMQGVIAELIARTGASCVTVTRGRHGSASADAIGGMREIPAFVESGFDTMGAGDAFLAVAGPLVAAGLDVEMAAFAGNVAGGLKTAILGHRRHISRDDLVKNIEWLLK